MQSLKLPYETAAALSVISWDCSNFTAYKYFAHALAKEKQINIYFVKQIDNVESTQNKFYDNSVSNS